ncbi:hypothetical protein DFS34DRAFT_412854 [Phlyctochytrium arcticum]|nr:hypothetical protein DFS34DRAFT_412854 [Phlyctochytrium arcticum]
MIIYFSFVRARLSLSRVFFLECLFVRFIHLPPFQHHHLSTPLLFLSHPLLFTFTFFFTYHYILYFLESCFFCSLFFFRYSLPVPHSFTLFVFDRSLYSCCCFSKI